MKYIEWVEREINIARKQRGCCGFDQKSYDKVLKIFDILLENGNLDISAYAVNHVLSTLIDEKPITPIEDIFESWKEVIRTKSGNVVYNCIRMPSLFKEVDLVNMTIKYKDNDRFTCVNSETGALFDFGLVTEYMNDILPIKFPYSPEKPIKVYCDECLTDPKNGDFDTFAILFYIDNDDKCVFINKFFKEVDGDWIPIEYDEYYTRYVNSFLYKK